MSDTHADTIRPIVAPLGDVLPLVVKDKTQRELVRVTASGDVVYTSEADLVEAIRLIAESAANSAANHSLLVADVERERARADRAEAALARRWDDWDALVTDAHRVGDLIQTLAAQLVVREAQASTLQDELAALSAGSGGRETTP